MQWTETQLESHRRRSIEIFRNERFREPLEQYLGFFDKGREAVASILEISVDLTRIREEAAAILGDAELVDAARYLCSPPVSKDDLETIADVSLAPTLIEKDPSRAATLMDVILLGFDRERFPWLTEDREPTEAERYAAIVATAAMLAFRQTETLRRNEGKKLQEQKVKDFLASHCGFTEVPARRILNMSHYPAYGTFSGEADVCGRKADVCVRLWDGRLMPIECKVSNSGTNSYKRINNDAAVKAVSWRQALGEANVVPAAVLSGVFVLKNLTYAQENRLSLYWSDDLEPLRQFIDEAR
ncbi:XamI family restriction endonuclease [Nonomuraea sp. NPDC004702]